MHILYPEIKPYAVHALKVDNPHLLYIEECGNPDGIPVLFLHGGPGAGCEPYHRRFFDPERYRIILFDQRGAGRSSPHAELENNHTAALVSDIERIRDYFSIKQWVLFGGSWGATLALLYAQAYPQQVKCMVLRGVFLCRPEDIHWFYQEGASRIFPDAWENFLKPIPPSERGNLLQAYYKRLTGRDELARMACAKAWSSWEGHCSTLRPNHMVLDHFGEPHTALSLARIECHYFMNHAFLEPNQILNQVAVISEIPGVIVHGRYDTVCPLEQAYSLHKAWPASELHIVRDAGHSASEASIVDALVRATDELANKFDVSG